jgi:predicted glycoside hydrolase/deacetylase ChbG (UPF0249 family)
VRNWIISADDFAIDAGAVDGIVDLIERGRLTATSALVDSPHWPAAARRLPAASRSGPRAPAAARTAAANEAEPDMIPGQADIGLHLNLTQAFGGARSGSGSGIWPLRELLARCALGAMARAPVQAAIARQLDAFEDALDRAPDYVDGHQHVHQFAIVRDELVAALQRRYAGRLPWIRSTCRPVQVRGAKARTIAALGDRQLRACAQAAGVRVNACLVGVYDFRADPAAYWRHLRRWLQVGPDGSVLMCHPARAAAGDDPIGPARMMEYAILASPEFAAALRQAGVVPVNGAALRA